MRSFKNKKENNYNVPVSFPQLMEIAKSFSLEEKILLARELEKETLYERFKQLLKSMKNIVIDENELASEIKLMRKERHAKAKKN